MRVPLSWLRDFVDVGDDVGELADRITSAGLEVTSIDRYGIEGAELVWERDKALLARVIEVSRHPDADRLVLAKVDYGADEPKVVVTGAPNLFEYIDKGDLRELRLYSPLVLEGALYRDPYKDGKATPLKGKKLRGVYNDSMLCSAVELGLGEGHDGIILIQEDAHSPEYTAGTPLQEVLGDAVLDIDIIPNVARCASILGVAREVAALYETELRPPALDLVMEGDPIEGRVVIETLNPELNPRFVALLIEGVEQRPAPFWMQHRLFLAGQRPINVVVDISNYVMLEIGQPNHTFDFDFLRRRADEYSPDGPVRIVTRTAEPGEKLVTLDGEEHELRTNNMLVTDPIGNLSVGGVMGGLNSEIQPETKNVLLEAAAWNFINVRRSSRQLGLHTDAGFRFSRGVHPSQALVGAKRAAELLRKLAGGVVARGIVDHQPLPIEPVTVSLEPSYVRRLTGLELSAGEIAALLERLEFAVRAEGDELLVTAPDHRMDIEGPHDLVEEVCRMYGYDRLPSTVLRDDLPPQRGNPALEQEERLRDLLVEQGLQEAITYRLTTPEAESKLGIEAIHKSPYVRVTNPSTNERVVMRHSVLASVLEIAAANSRFRDRIRLFELGHRFLVEEGERLPREAMELAIVMTGPRSPAHWAGGITHNQVETCDYFDLKGTLETVLASLRVAADFQVAERDGFRPGRTARLVLMGSDQEVGVLGELHPAVVERFDLRIEADQPVIAASIDLDALLAGAPNGFAVKAVPAFPAIREDLALVVDNKVSASQVEQKLFEAGGALLSEAQLFDVYEGESLGRGKKSLAYHLTYQSPSKTLRDKDADRLRNRLLSVLEKSLGATLRE